MKKLLLIGFLLLFSPMLSMSFLYAAEVTLAWDANKESDLAGYRLHYGTESGKYGDPIDVGNVTEYSITGLAEGTTYYFVATAYDEDKNESAYSIEVSWVADSLAPSKVLSFKRKLKDFIINTIEEALKE